MVYPQSPTKGRKPTSRARAGEILALKAEGRSIHAIAGELGISVGSMHSALKALAEAA